ncbi:hypothetical protein J45TS6_31990 [Paenibacillus sp. J45TS6]|uniref:hypothetical protein n=1 Tax=Paenibacillus sp. J45TS6 TaxID=2807196 RepID=UPI001B24A3BE|nr:hypothetical protein [Paenibacillus sp. J45TS6]GIP44740.1 hypothetical protein J45TS6_31990 [Paenibacillus sp. J45TS6]
MNRVSLYAFSFLLLFLTIACSQESRIDMSDTLVKSEDYFRELEEIDTTASAFDGKKEVKFRLMIDGHPSESEASTLFNDIMDVIAKYSNSDVWDYYNGYFDIKNYDNGVIYEGTKLIGEDLKVQLAIMTNNYKFIGESEHWKAQYSYKGTEKWEEEGRRKTYSNEDSYDFIIKYKGPLEELSSLQKLKYSYETISSSGDSTREFTEPPLTDTFSSSGSSKGGAKVAENEVIKVNVTWDDLEESFKLHNNK